MHRDFNTAFWDDPWVQRLSDRAQHLYIYLANNSLCSACGIYEITLERISFDTKIDSTLLPSLLAELTIKVSWNPDTSVIWVKGFFRWQSHSPKFQLHALQSLKQFPSYYSIWYRYHKDTLSIPYPYPTDTIAIETETKDLGLRTQVLGLREEKRRETTSNLVPDKQVVSNLSPTDKVLTPYLRLNPTLNSETETKKPPISPLKKGDKETQISENLGTHKAFTFQDWHDEALACSSDQQRAALLIDLARTHSKRPLPSDAGGRAAAIVKRCGNGNIGYAVKLLWDAIAEEPAGDLMRYVLGILSRQERKEIGGLHEKRREMERGASRGRPIKTI